MTAPIGPQYAADVAEDCGNRYRMWMKAGIRSPGWNLCFSPAMIRRMPGLHRHEFSATSGTDLPVGNQFTFNDCPIGAGFNHPGTQLDGLVGRGGALQRDR